MRTKPKQDELIAMWMLGEGSFVSFKFFLLRLLWEGGPRGHGRKSCLWNEIVTGVGILGFSKTEVERKPTERDFQTDFI